MHGDETSTSRTNPTICNNHISPTTFNKTQNAPFVFNDKMIVEEANKVVQWEQTMELARRDAMQHAADMHGHGGAFAPGTQQERNELVQAMMSQKVNIMLLSTVRAESVFDFFACDLTALCFVVSFVCSTLLRTVTTAV